MLNGKYKFESEPELFILTKLLLLLLQNEGASEDSASKLLKLVECAYKSGKVAGLELGLSVISGKITLAQVRENIGIPPSPAAPTN